MHFSNLQIPNQLSPRLCKRAIYTSYTILSIWSIYIINNWCLPPTWFVFVFFFCLHTTFAISCPPFNTTILLHYKWSLFISLYDVEKKLLEYYWTFQICHTSKSTSTRPRRIDYRIVEKNTISVCKFFRSYDSLSRKRIK